MKKVSREAAAALFLSRQHLDRPRERPLSARAVSSFVADAGGLQLDSINVLERAHYLTLWSRFGAYDKGAVDRLAYETRDLFEYWAHAACLVAASDLPGWRRAMVDFRGRHTGWSDWLKASAKVLRQVEGEIRRRGPLTGGDFARPKSQGKAEGWWDWHPAQHALQFLWLSGRLGVHSRRHFQKSFDLAERIFPEVEPIARERFGAWHIRKSLRAMGAATEADLRSYLSYPRLAPAARRRALAGMLKSGEVVEVAVEGSPERWFALAEDLKALESPPRPRGTTLLSPFDSLLWHRSRAKALFGFDYKIEVYTPAPKRVYGYYTLPILHDGRLVGLIDPKNHRSERRLEVRKIHFFKKPGAGLIKGVAGALDDLARFLGAETVSAPAPLREAVGSVVQSKSTEPVLGGI